MKNSKKKLFVIFLVVKVILCLVVFTACNKATEGGEFDLPQSSFPSSLANTISADDQSIIDAGMQEGATEEQKKLAVMTMYTIANNSRITADQSLMVQKTDMIPAVAIGHVYMRGFTLKTGNSWFYQFAAQGVSEASFLTNIMNAVGSQQIQIAYTKGDGKYYYLKELSDKPECNCTITTFPYATFKITDDMTLKEYATEQEFQVARYYLKSQLEINNMNLVKEIIADGSKITYDASKHLYTVEFEVDCENSDEDLLKSWYECANKDMKDSGNEIFKYNYWKATMELWDNGYVKSFIQEEDKEAGDPKKSIKVAGGQVTNAYEYLYGTMEIKSLLDKDPRFVNGINLTYTPQEYVTGYQEIANNRVPATLGKFTITIIVVVVVLVVVIVGIIVLIEVLVKKGKLPKLAAKRAKRKEKRLAKKNKGEETPKEGIEEDSSKEDEIEKAEEVEE